MSPKGLKYIFHLIGRKLFRKERCNEVEYGQTLTKKRRKNCVLKSVATLSETCHQSGFNSDGPYHIKFEFTSDDREFRGSVLNFQKIDPVEDVCCLRRCCERSFCTRCSVSSDSACEVSSCCEYSHSGRSVEDFIRIHSEHFLRDWYTDEPNYETLSRPKSDCDYDILLSKSNCSVLEPSYENLKLVENFYETPRMLCAENCAVRKIKDLVQSNKTYDEVIQSLKVLHSNSDAANDEITVENCKCVSEGGDNDINNYLENFKSMETNNNNDVESVSFQF